MSYIRGNFLLTNKTAEKLYNDYAKNMPIFDYHCHLSEKQILRNEPFNDIFEIWLSGDHYKWRLMRNYGINEEFITGKTTSNKEKFMAYCKTLGTAFGNPLYHWSQVELRDFFHCEIEINEANADPIWNCCNDYIKLNKITPQKLIEQSHVTHLYTTNEIFDDLSTFDELKKKDYKFKVIPAFRTDKIMNIDAEGYNETIGKLGDITSINCLLKEIERRLQSFVLIGATAADITLQKVYPIGTKEEAEKIFKKRRSGEIITEREAGIFKGYLTYFLFILYSRYDMVTELHIGAMRNNNTVMLKKLGIDTGYDSLAEDNSIKNMSRLFDRLNLENSLPKTIIFNLNPKMNAEIMSLIGCFQSDEAKGKLQYGAAWWFLDNKLGIEKHFADLTSIGHIGTFVGMLTDSRSFLSYSRHHYFRRILCNYLGVLMESGEMTTDIAFVGEVVKDICYRNALVYFKEK